ncbi:MAG TPA: hypothetical protein VFF79_17490 [Conexibacter sp.]|jgi:hypothetical protein|nr:hypothetical protein [Conexibacter sp.]
MLHSQAWRDFIVNLREATQLLRADPASAGAARHSFPSKSDLALTAALTKGCVMLTSGRLQGCIESQTQEFLERIDESGVMVDSLPEDLRGALCSQYFRGKSTLSSADTIEVHKTYAALWISGTVLPAGLLKTDSLPDEIWNPRPHRVRKLMRRCDIDLFSQIQRDHGSSYLEDMRRYVDELIDFRNAVAHGSEVLLWTAGDVLFRMRWATRLARTCDRALGQKLVEITGDGW